MVRKSGRRGKKMADYISRHGLIEALCRTNAINYDGCFGAYTIKAMDAFSDKRTITETGDSTITWTQPDSTNPYMAGDIVRHNNKTWVSDMDYNVFEPGIAGWSDSLIINVGNASYPEHIVSHPEPDGITPFKCPCCGGNSYKTMNGKTVCAYCDTEFLR